MSKLKIDFSLVPILDMEHKKIEKIIYDKLITLVNYLSENFKNIQNFLADRFKILSIDPNQKIQDFQDLFFISKTELGKHILNISENTIFQDQNLILNLFIAFCPKGNRQEKKIDISVEGKKRKKTQIIFIYENSNLLEQINLFILFLYQQCWILHQRDSAKLINTRINTFLTNFYPKELNQFYFNNQEKHIHELKIFFNHLNTFCFKSNLKNLEFYDLKFMKGPTENLNISQIKEIIPSNEETLLLKYGLNSNFEIIDANKLNSLLIPENFENFKKDFPIQNEKLKITISNGIIKWSFR